MFQRGLLILVLVFTPIMGFGAVSINDIGIDGPSSSIIQGDMTMIDFLTLIQSILLKVLLPLLVVGTALYVAYQLFTAEGDETRMKHAWRSVAYSAIALIIIALAYALVAIFSNIAI